MGYIFLVIALVLNAGANTMMKLGAKNLSLFQEYGLIQGLLKNYVVLIGISLFAINVVFYILALSKINLSIAYPFMTVGGILVITTISYLFFGEVLTSIQLGGVALLAVGIILLTGKF